MTGLLLAAAFVTGLLVRDVARVAYDRWLVRKWERELKAAKARMVGCNHERTVLVDVGMGPVTEKCLDCWALRMDLRPYQDGPVVSKWTANMTRPPK